MGTKRRFMKGVLALSLVAVLSSCGLAASPSGYTSQSELSNQHSQATLRQEGSTGAVIEEGTVLSRASKLMGRPMKNTEGQTLGTVHDLVLTPDYKAVSYIALSRGGLFGLGRSLHAIPWSIVHIGIGNTIVAPIDKVELKQDRGFNEAYWPNEGDPRWVGRAGLEEMPSGAGMVADRDSIRNRRVTRITGNVVKEPAGKNAGTVHDLVIAMDSGRVAYTIVSHGGLLGLGSQWAAVPQGAITFEPYRQVARLQVNKEVLQVNSFAPGAFPALSDPAYARSLSRAYDVESEGAVLGYIAAEEPTTRTPARPAAPPARDTTTMGTPAPGVTLAEPTEAELTATFDPARVRTIEGTVTDLGKFRPAAGRDMLWLRIRTNAGQIYTVNVGPRDYISKQDFYVVKGDRIRLTGSEAMTSVAGKYVFLPTEITYENHVLRLRSTQGNPLWEQEMRETGQRPGEMGQVPAEPDRDGDILGYVPGEERAATTTPGARPAETARESAARLPAPATQFPSIDAQAIGAFDRANLRTLEGTVTEVGKSKPATVGGVDIVWLRVTTMDGRTLYVQVGPRDYLSRQDFFVVNGDRVRMNGWDIRPGTAGTTTPVFILADITQNGHQLQLRNRSGDPLWTSQQYRPGQQPGMTTPPSTERPSVSESEDVFDSEEFNMDENETPDL